MSSFTEEDQENLLKWILRYVLIPVSLAVITGLFAIKVIKLEIASRTPGPGDVVDAVFATMTAVAPPAQPGPEVATTPQPSQTPTVVEPTAPQESGLGPTPVAEVTVPGVSVAVCGQIPAGWRLYLVQRGNTLFSLAQQSGTTVADIRQVNCLYGQLIAGSQIWLPPIFARPTAEPVVGLTAEPIVESPVALPDLINSISDLPTVSVQCDSGLDLTNCVTTVAVAVANVGTAGVSSFDVLVRLDPDQSVTLVDVVEGLGVGDTAVLNLTSPPGPNCYDPDCTVCISVDSRGAVLEADEGNNQYCTTLISPVGGG